MKTQETFPKLLTLEPFENFATAFTMTVSTEDAWDDSIAPSMEIGTFWLEETATAVSVGPGCGKTFSLNETSFRTQVLRKMSVRLEVVFIRDSRRGELSNF